MSSISSSTSPSALTDHRPKGRAKACTNCRQVKLKCNARETWPQPCFRCKAQRTECRMDSSFRRVPARRQLEEVSQKLNNLQRLLDSGHQNFDIAKSATNLKNTEQGGLDREHDKPILAASAGVLQSTSHPLLQHTQLEANRHISLSNTPVKFLDLGDEPRTSSWSLGGVTVTYDVAVALFSHFAEHKWHHIPILQSCKSLEKLYTESDLLFWTIILQAARNHGLYESYFSDLMPHHRSLLSSSLLEQPSLSTLHALLIVCTWPYPSPRQTPEEIKTRILRSRDSSWILLGAAVNMATMMGLHKPGHQDEYGYDPRDTEKADTNESYIRDVTWLYTFQLVTSQSSWLGISPPLSSASHLETVARFCRDENIPRWLRAKIDIQRRVVQFTIQLDTVMDLRTRYSLINVFEQYLNRARESFADVWSQELEIDNLGAKLYLYGIAFVNSPQNVGYAPIEDPGIMARNILQRGLTAAVQLCHTVCNMTFDGIKVPGNYSGRLSSYTYQLSWYPRRFHLAVAFATIFLAWFLAVDTQALDADRQLARKYMTDVRMMYASFHHSQEHLNLGLGLENLTTIQMNAPRLTVSSRLGASFMYSYNFMYKHLKTMDAKTGTTGAQNSVGSHEMMQDVTKSTEKREMQRKGDPISLETSNSLMSPLLVPISWDMSWSEWDPAVFEELQSLNWGQSP